MSNTPGTGNESPAPWWGYHVEEVLEREGGDTYGFYAVCGNFDRLIVAKYSVELHPNAERAAIRECKRLNKRELRKRKKERKKKRKNITQNAR